MGLKKILRLEFNSKFLRSVLNLFYKQGKFYRILFGRLKGFKAYYRHDVNFHAILGFWERDSLEVLVALFRQFGLDKKKTIIADVGANMGYYSLFFARYLHPDSQIFAFEPSVSILDVVKKNLSANNVKNVTLLNEACYDKTGEVTFYIGWHHHKSSVVADWSDNRTRGERTTVKAISLNDFFYDGKKESLPDLIKMDIEGGGVYALQGCDRCIAEKRPFIIIESHTPEEDMAISNVLLRYDYEAYRVNTKQWVKKRDINHSDPDGVWGTMLLLPKELKDKFTI